MQNVTRYHWALASYWLLFVMTPVIGAFIAFGLSTAIVAVCVASAIIGEHAFRRWKRLWKVDSN